MWHPTITRDQTLIVLDRSRPLFLKLFLKRAMVASGNKRGKEHFMLDIVMLALGLGFFAVGTLYGKADKKLADRDQFRPAREAPTFPSEGLIKIIALLE